MSEEFERGFVAGWEAAMRHQAKPAATQAAGGVCQVCGVPGVVMCGRPSCPCRIGGAGTRITSVSVAGIGGAVSDTQLWQLPQNGG